MSKEKRQLVDSYNNRNKTSYRDQQQGLARTEKVLEEKVLKLFLREEEDLALEQTCLLFHLKLLASVLLLWPLPYQIPTSPLLEL